MVDLEWLRTTGWLDSKESTVRVPPAMLREMADELERLRNPVADEQTRYWVGGRNGKA